MIRGLKKAGVAVLISSHLLDRVQSVCDRVALFNHGKIALMGTVVELANQVLGAGHPHPGRGERHRRAGGAARHRGRAAASCRKVRVAPGGSWPIATSARRRPSASSSAGGSLTRLAELQPSLEEVYTRYFEEARHAA